MNYFDKRGRKEVEDRRKVADRRTLAPHVRESITRSGNDRRQIPDMNQSIARVRPMLVDQPKSLRDEIAMEAMKVLLNDQSLRESDDAFYEEVARDAYGYADAMMDARKAGEE